MHVHSHLWIDGQWQAPHGSETCEVLNPTTEEPIGRIPLGDAHDIDRAVRGARRIFPSWSQTPPSERASILRDLAARLKPHRDEFARLIALEVGAPLKLARNVHVGLPISILESFADVAESFPFEEPLGPSLIVREPIGVAGGITPWNFPLHQVVAKVAASIAGGCPIVIKPSELAPLTVFRFAELIADSALPDGVFQLVSGLGPIAGEALARHPEVDMISFTGSTRAGSQVAAAAAPTVKRVAQELGGKSANVLLSDADFDRAVRHGVSNCFFNSGQTCSALTRMLVPADRQEEVIERSVEASQKFVLGDPLDRETRLGPLISAEQRDRVRRYIRRGIEDGARLATGGETPPDGLDRGFFVRPTIFGAVTNTMVIAREEIFGPVLSILPYRTEEEAIAIANDSPFGLSGAVWSADEDRALSVARRLRTGQVDINGGGFNPQAPFGGYKQSGNGREFGSFGLEEFLEVKAIQQG